MNENRKCLLVLGASSEIGCELINRIHKNYDIIVAHYCTSKEKLEILEKKLGKKLIPMQADFSSETDIRNMTERINLLNILPDHIVYLAAGKFRNIKFAKTSSSAFQNEMSLSVFALIQVLESFIALMVKRGSGKIVVMLSSCTLNQPPKYISPYVVSKYGLLGLVKALASEYADKGITVNAVSPEMIETKFLSEIPDIIVQKNAQVMPIGRNLKVTDVVPTFEYLLSEGADCVTGQNLAVTAGK